MKQHKIPERMCVACRKMFPKTQLLRIVNDPERGSVIDESGKAGGRGVYLCTCKDCIARTLKNKSFAKVNGFSLSDSVRLQLENIANGQN